MRVLFLDIDGVLNSRAYFDKLEKETGEPDTLSWEPQQIDPEAVARLNRVLERSTAVVVVSSTWRLGKTTGELQAILNARGFTGKLIGKTPDFFPHADEAELEKAGLTRRGAEIASWVQGWGADPMRANLLIERIAIVDDDKVGGFPGLEVNTSFERGLEDEHVEALVKILTFGYGEAIGEREQKPAAPVAEVG